MKKTKRVNQDPTVYWIVGIAAVAIIGAVIAIVATQKSGGESTLAGQEFPDQGREHINLTDPHPAYNSNPPTSGWHFAQAAPWGPKTEEIPDEILVHNLEHGGIWISYKPDVVSNDVRDKLTAFASTHQRVIVTPRPKNDSAIALTSWQHLLKLDQYDEAKIADFYTRNFNHAPEDVP